MRRAVRSAWLGLGFVAVSACANIAGIEAGHLRDDATANGGSASTAGSTSGSASTMNGGNTPNGGSTSLGGTVAGDANSSGGTSGTGDSGGTVGIARHGSSGGTSGGSTGTGGASAGTGGSLLGEGGSSACPADMVRAESTQSDPFCIDAYEVTNSQYLAFTQAHTAATTTQPTACSGNTTFLPSSSCGNALNDIPSRAIPVVCVDWCDAAAYCSSVGKRLCGRIGGVANPQADAADSDACEWYAACAGPDDHAQSGETCNGSSFDANATTPKAAAKIPDCEGGVTGLFNMSGNVAEWENSCSGTAAAAECNTRGGSFQDGPYELECSSTNSASRLSQSATIGIRCCAEAE